MSISPLAASHAKPLDFSLYGPTCDDMDYMKGPFALPADVQSGDVLAIAVTALVLGVAATLYPAWRAAATQPADALRHEV